MRVEAVELGSAAGASEVVETVFVEHPGEVILGVGLIAVGRGVELDVGVFDENHDGALVAVCGELRAAARGEEAVAFLIGRAVVAVGSGGGRLHQTGGHGSRRALHRTSRAGVHTRPERRLVDLGQERAGGRATRFRMTGLDARVDHVAVGRDVAIIEVATLLKQRIAVFGEILVEGLVARQADAELGAVGCLDCQDPPLRRLGDQLESTCGRYRNESDL